jgi:YHS domain-containing protein
LREGGLGEENCLSDFWGPVVYIGAMKTLIVGGLLAAVMVAGSMSSIAADKKDAKKEYPLKTCVVSDEKLGSMGKPYVIKHEGKEVQFCCKGCEKDFKKDPAKYLKKIDEAAKKAK